MDDQKLKKGRIDKIEEEAITIFNHDGECEDKLAIFPQDAEDIRSEIGLGQEVYYVIQGDKLLAIGLEDFVSEEARRIYEGSPRERGCVIIAK
jgi:hypothetical protein